jgi:hypothetical protein
MNRGGGSLARDNALFRVKGYLIELHPRTERFIEVTLAAARERAMSLDRKGSMWKLEILMGAQFLTSKTWVPTVPIAVMAPITSQ